MWVEDKFKATPFFCQSFRITNRAVSALALIAVLFLALQRDAQAQFVNIMLDQQTADHPYVCEPAVAINPKDVNNIVAASVLNNLYVTKDGGAAWQKIDVKSPYGVYGDPALVTDRKGNFYFFHLSDPTHGTGGYESEKLDRIVVQISTDGGYTWSEGESIGLNHPKDQDKEWAVVDQKGNLYVTWTQFDEYGSGDPNCLTNILFSKSGNGKKWSAPVQISQTPGNCLDSDHTTEGAVPAVSFDGKVFVAWANQEKIFFDRSFNGGETWLRNDLAIADQPGGWDINIPGHDRCNGMPVTVVNNSKTNVRGHVYVLWADQRNGAEDTDIWFIRSANNGDNWTTPLRVNNDGKGKHNYLPWMAVDDVTGYIYVVFYDRRNYDDLQTDVYLAWSADGGGSFENVKISEAPFTPSEESFFGDYTNITAHKGVIVPVWARMDDGRTSVWTSIIRHEDLVKEKKK